MIPHLPHDTVITVIFCAIYLHQFWGGAASSATAAAHAAGAPRPRDIHYKLSQNTK